MFCETEMLQPKNPTNIQRYELLKYMLEQYGRTADFTNIIRGLAPPMEITKLAEPGSLKGIKIGVLGAGVAGLSTAYELRKMGAEIEIIEAQKEHIGGKCYTYFFDRDNYGELGPMRIPVSHECTWHYINLFKLPTSKFVMNNPHAFIYIRKTRVRNDEDGKGVMEKIYPMFDLTHEERETSWKELLVQGLMMPLYSVSPDIRQQILYQLPQYNPTMKSWFAKDITEVMAEMGISTGAINMLSNLAFVLSGYPESSYSESFQENYTGDFEYLYQIDGGIYQLPMALYEALTTDGKGYYQEGILNQLGSIKIRMGEEVTGINYKKRGEVEVITKSLEKNVPLKKTYDYVVCALPFSAVRILEINPPLEVNREWAIQQAYYQDIQKTLLLCNRRFWLEPEIDIDSGGSLTDLAIQSVWYPKDGIKDPNASGVLIASYNLGLNANRLGTMEPERRIEVIKRQIEELHGLEEGYLDDVVMAYKTLNYKSNQWYQGMCYYNPSQKTDFAKGMLVQSYDGHLQFAGVHMSSTHGWMQGSFKTAMEVANNVVEEIKSKKPRK